MINLRLLVPFREQAVIFLLIYIQITVEKEKNIWYNRISINYFRVISDVIFT